MKYCVRIEKFLAKEISTNAMKYVAKSVLEKIVGPDMINAAWSAIKLCIIIIARQEGVIKDLKKVI